MTISNNSHHFKSCKQYQVNPFDLSTDLFCRFSNQVIHLVISLNGSVQYDLLKKAVHKASFSEPITRCRIIKDKGTLFWEECSLFDTYDSVLQLSSRTPEKLLYQALSYPLDPYQGKLFQVILIKNGEKTGDIVVVNAHHIVMDGRGLKDFTKLIMKSYTEFYSGQMTESTITSISSRLLPRVSTLMGEGNLVNSSDSSIGWCSQISVPLRSVDVSKYQYSTLILNQNRTAIIHNDRRKWGITVNDLMIAVLSRAISSILTETSEIVVPLYTTVDLRRFLPIIPMRSLVNFSTSFEVRVPIKSAESLEDTGKRVHLLMKQKKSQRPGLDEAIEAEKVFDSGYSAAQELIHTAWKNILDAGCKTTIFSNTGIINGEDIISDCLTVRNAYILPGLFQPPGFFFLLSTFGDIMTLSASYAVPAYDPDLVCNMFSSVDRDIPGFLTYPGEYQIID